MTLVKKNKAQIAAVVQTKVADIHFCQNMFTGVSKCPLLTGIKELVEF